jgi:hypothetical protein
MVRIQVGTSSIGHFSLSPSFHGERVGVRGSLNSTTLGDSPSPEIRYPRISTSPRKRGEVTELAVESFSLDEKFA